MPPGRLAALLAVPLLQCFQDFCVWLPPTTWAAAG